ncbi:hypothetical protein SHKM778_22250 [Streptomyces sp. KM77-8]|uniref:Uncharacterized protein n=1 Tax=Streptomyces haneummycinicus TaxID=3074435 RepID=A0AAT9HEN7_9ACTN
MTVRTYGKGAVPGLAGNRSLHGVLLGARRTAADAQAVDQRTEALDVLLGEVLQQPTALTDQDEQTTTGVVVVLVALEVLRQVGDPTRQQSDLDLGEPVSPSLVPNSVMICFFTAASSDTRTPHSL